MCYMSYWEEVPVMLLRQYSRKNIAICIPSWNRCITLDVLLGEVRKKIGTYTMQFTNIDAKLCAINCNRDHSLDLSPPQLPLPLPPFPKLHQLHFPPLCVISESHWKSLVPYCYTTHILWSSFPFSASSLQSASGFEHLGSLYGVPSCGISDSTSF